MPKKYTNILWVGADKSRFWPMMLNSLLLTLDQIFNLLNSQLHLSSLNYHLLSYTVKYIHRLSRFLLHIHFHTHNLVSVPFTLNLPFFPSDTMWKLVQHRTGRSLTSGFYVFVWKWLSQQKCLRGWGRGGGVIVLSLSPTTLFNHQSTSHTWTN